MSAPYKINDELSIYIVTDVGDNILHRTFYDNLYKNVFSNEENNLKAGIVDMNSVGEVIENIQK
jgi:hypothetical protein